MSVRQMRVFFSAGLFAVVAMSNAAHANVSLDELRFFLNQRAALSMPQRIDATVAAIDRLTPTDPPIVILELSLAIASEIEFSDRSYASIPELYAAGLALARQEGDRLREASFMLRQRLLRNGAVSLRARNRDELAFVWATLELERNLVASTLPVDDFDRIRHIFDIYAGLRYASGEEGSPEYVRWVKRLVAEAREIKASFPAELVEAQRQLAIVSASNGEISAARQLVEEALAGALKVRSQALFSLHVTRAWVEAQGGDYEASSRSLDQALPLRRTHAANTKTSLTVLLRAVAAKQRLGEWTRAAELLLDAQRELPASEPRLTAFLDALLALQHLHAGENRAAVRKIDSSEASRKRVAAEDTSEIRALLDEAQLRLAIAEEKNLSSVTSSMTALTANQRRASFKATPQLAAAIDLLDFEDSANRVAALQREKAAAELEIWQAESRRSAFGQLLVIASTIIIIGLIALSFYRGPSLSRKHAIRSFE